MSQSRVLILGGGTAGISVAARLRAAGQADVTVIEPSDTHDYQPLWTLVGGGRAPLKQSRRGRVLRDAPGASPGSRTAPRPSTRGAYRHDRGRPERRLRLPRRLPRHPARLGRGPRHGRRADHAGRLHELQLRGHCRASHCSPDCASPRLCSSLLRSPRSSSRHCPRCSARRRPRTWKPSRTTRAGSRSPSSSACWAPCSTCRPSWGSPTHASPRLPGWPAQVAGSPSPRWPASSAYGCCRASSSRRSKTASTDQ